MSYKGDMLPIWSHSIGKRDERVRLTWSSFEVLDRHRRQLMNNKKKFTPFCSTSFDGLFGRIRFCLDHGRGKIYLLMNEVRTSSLILTLISPMEGTGVWFQVQDRSFQVGCFTLKLKLPFSKQKE